MKAIGDARAGVHAGRRALQRIEYPEDVVGTAVYLLSDDSAFVTGQVIVVDGGIVAH